MHATDKQVWKCVGVMRGMCELIQRTSCLGKCSSPESLLVRKHGKRDVCWFDGDTALGAGHLLRGLDGLVDRIGRLEVHGCRCLRVVVTVGVVRVGFRSAVAFFGLWLRECLSVSGVLCSLASLW